MWYILDPGIDARREVQRRQGQILLPKVWVKFYKTKVCERSFSVLYHEVRKPSGSTLYGSFQYGAERGGYPGSSSSKPRDVDGPSHPLFFALRRLTCADSRYKYKKSMILFPLGEGEEGDNQYLLGEGVLPHHPPAATNPWINPQPSTPSTSSQMRAISEQFSCHCALCQHESPLRLLGGVLSQSRGTEEKEGEGGEGASQAKGKGCAREGDTRSSREEIASMMSMRSVV